MELVGGRNQKLLPGGATSCAIGWCDIMMAGSLLQRSCINECMRDVDREKHENLASMLFMKKESRSSSCEGRVTPSQRRIELTQNEGLVAGHPVKRGIKWSKRHTNVTR